MKCLFILALLCSPLAAEQATAILTAYCGGPCCCTPFPGKVPLQTASGKQAKQGRTLAAPKSIPFGSEVWIVDGDGNGGKLGKGVLLGIVEDRGGAIKMKGKKIKIDIYMDSHKEALKFGIKTAIVEIKRGKK